MITIDCISDLHGHKPELEGGDLLIVAGDLCRSGITKEYLEFFHWFDDQQYKKKIFISGNHDNQGMSQFDWGENAIYLLDSITEFEGLKIWGSPWTSQFPGINPHCCAFTRPFMSSLKDRWDLIPDDVDILITHSPPYGILDQIETEYGAHVGDKDLRDALDNRLKPKLHVFGHIHENGGKQLVLKRPGYGEENNTICVNASVVDERYRLVNKPVRIIL